MLQGGYFQMDNTGRGKRGPLTKTGTATDSKNSPVSTKGNSIECSYTINQASRPNYVGLKPYSHAIAYQSRYLLCELAISHYLTHIQHPAII